MKCELEFLPVGDASKAGDAIIARYGAAGSFQLMLIDGGNSDCGQMIVDRLRGLYGHNVKLEHVLLTHSDNDHASGLRAVLEQIPVANLWMHIPWRHAVHAKYLFKFPWTDEGIERKVKAEYSILSEIVELAEAQGTVIRYPFENCAVGPFKVLSPSGENYLFLLPQFEKTPEPNKSVIEDAGLWLGKESLISKLLSEAASAKQEWTRETYAQELLRDGGCTSASNESSVVLYGEFECGPILLTGDAGINGLTWAAEAADAGGLPLQQFATVQIPHHGSRRNIGPSILNRLIGPIRAEGSVASFWAVVSAPKDDAKHPRKVVLNAFTRRGGLVTATQGESVIISGGCCCPSKTGHVLRG